MNPLQVARIIFGFALVLFIPGFALTLALWPKSKKDVQKEVVEAFKEQNVSEVCAVGSFESEGLTSALEENSIVLNIYDPYTADIETIEILANAKALLLTENLEYLGITVDPENKVVVDLVDNFPNVIKIEDTLDMVERIALSFGLSIAIVPLLGLALDKTGFGIRLESVFTSLVLMILLFFGGYYYRKHTA
ncbi:MAG: DUF1616 domain-containing protein [Candidatus Hydrothermarchaeales archaeon]